MKEIDLSKSYHAKLILLGEYGIIQGGEILALPLKDHFGNWTIGNKNEDGSLQKIKSYLSFIKEANHIDFDKMEYYINLGLKYQSNIPSGYGIGSSGALSAAIYDAFYNDEYKSYDLNTQLSVLAAIESYYHGISSGIDPLVSYINKGIHIKDNNISLVESAIDISRYFLIDTHKSRSTAPLVDQFVLKTKDDEFQKELEKYLQMISQTIAACTTGNIQHEAIGISKISRWQYDHLDFAIPKDFDDLWLYSLDRKDFSIKLCGAGGGGYLLGYADNVDQIIAELSDYDLQRIH